MYNLSSYDAQMHRENAYLREWINSKWHVKMSKSSNGKSIRSIGTVFTVLVCMYT